MDKNGDGVVTKEVNIKQDFKAQMRDSPKKSLTLEVKLFKHVIDTSK